MMKKYKWKLLISSMIILLPIVVGLILWDKLPENMITHWGADGVADGWSSKGIAIFLVPCILLVAHWICFFITTADSGNKGQSDKVMGMILWIMPMVSLMVEGISYSIALGTEINIGLFVVVLIGLMFIVIGNYLPKCKQNSTIGIKLPWTLSNEENWNKTHRLCGKLWVAAGFLILFCIFLPQTFQMGVSFIVMISAIVVPTIYSYSIYRRQRRDGKIEEKAHSTLTKGTLIFTVIILAALGILLGTGDIEVQYGDNSFQVKASYWNDLEVDYEVIESIVYKEKDNAGSRVGGFGSPRLQIGNFENEEYGRYTRYCYTGCESAVVLTIEGKILVLNGPDSAGTKEIYNSLLQKVE